MDERTQYAMALGAFRQQSALWVASARALSQAARTFDPQGTAPDDPAAQAVLGEVAAELRALASLVPGIRQLLAFALGGSS